MRMNSRCRQLDERRPSTRVTPWLHDCGMTDDEVLRAAAFDGFELEERAWQDAWVWGWSRGDDRRWPCYLEQRQAINWMRDRLSRGRVFA